MAMDQRELCWRVEETCLNAWPALRQAHYGGWMLRFSGGLTRRANSANALSGSRDDGDAFFVEVEALYRHQRQPAIYRLTSLIGDATDRRLDARGYGKEGPSLVLYREFGPSPEAFDPAVRLLARPSPGWFAAMAALQSYGARNAALYRRIVGAVPVPAAYAMLVESDHDQPAALAYGAIHRRILCYVSVVTDPDRRRRGHARRIIASLAAWAADEGARAACLEVEAANAPALALYEGLGFREVYRYHYRRQPA
jgi:N-acetylglutamate synthase